MYLVNHSHISRTVLMMVPLWKVFLCHAGCNYFKTKDFKYFIPINLKLYLIF